MSYPSKMRREDRATTGDSGYARSIFRKSRHNTFPATPVVSRNIIQEFEVYELSSSDLNKWLRGLFEDENEDFKILVSATSYSPATDSDSMADQKR